MSYYIAGGKGWIGSQLAEMLRSQGKKVTIGQVRIENRDALEAEIRESGAAFVLNCAGKTGSPNVDWCEDHKPEVLRSNVCGALNVCDAALACGAHVTYYGTGCIYQYDETHKIHDGHTFTEEDEPNFTGSFYSFSKVHAEQLMKTYPNVLILRIRMPISDDLHPRSFVTKITKYSKVIDIPNSMTVLHEMLPVSLDMTEKRLTGVYNFVNPGAISHNEVLTLYRDIVDPTFTWSNFDKNEQLAMCIKAPRSNNELSAAKLLALYPDVPDVFTAVRNAMIRIRAAKDAAAAAAAKKE